MPTIHQPWEGTHPTLSGSLYLHLGCHYESKRIDLTAPLVLLDVLQLIASRARTTLASPPALANSVNFKTAVGLLHDSASVAKRRDFKQQGQNLVREAISLIIARVLHETLGDSEPTQGPAHDWIGSYLTSTPLLGMISFVNGLYGTPMDKIASDYLKAYIYAFSIDENGGSNKVQDWLSDQIEDLVHFIIKEFILNNRSATQYQQQYGGEIRDPWEASPTEVEEQGFVRITGNQAVPEALIEDRSLGSDIEWKLKRPDIRRIAVGAANDIELSVWFKDSEDSEDIKTDRDYSFLLKASADVTVSQSRHVMFELGERRDYIIDAEWMHDLDGKSGLGDENAGVIYRGCTSSFFKGTTISVWVPFLYGKYPLLGTKTILLAEA